ncbi:MAG: endonuclease/exonuclease/phosphatase family protein, partial [Planctomycetota bacterium]
MVASAKGLIGTSSAPAQVRGKRDRTLRVVTLNLAHGRGLAPNQALVESDVISSNLQETAGYLDDLDADIVGLQEVDKNCNWSGNCSQARRIAEHTQFSDYRLGVNNNRAGRYQLVYGNALLSQYPVQQYQNYPFSDSSIGGKGFLVAGVEVGDRTLTFCVVHLAPVGKRIRRRQIRKIIAALEDR